MRVYLEDDIAKNLTAINSCLEEIARIKYQLRKWDGRRQRGEAGFDSWFHGAKRTLDEKKAEHIKLMERQSDLKRQLNEEKVKEEAAQRASFDRAFRDAAKASLPPETYAELTEAAKRLMEKP